MEMIESSTLMSPRLRTVVGTGADDESAGTLQRHRLERSQEQQKQREGWERVIDRRLIDWGRDPSQLEDDELDAPTTATIQLAIELATAMRDANSEPPSRVVPDAHGGIVFELERGPVFKSFHVLPDGKVEFAHFKNRRLVHRSRIL